MNEANHDIEVEQVEATDVTPAESEAPAEPGAPAETSEAIEGPPVRMANVAEAIRYRKRAQAAERELAETRARLDEATREAEAAQQRLAQVERGAAIDRGLADAGVADLEAARLLVDAALSDSEADVAAAIEAVQRDRPQLFRVVRSGPGPTAAMGPAVRTSPQGSREIERAASAARHTGHNADVMHYMNLRRSASR